MIRARSFQSQSPEETRRAACELARELSAGSVVALYGELGAGKTCFVQGLAEGLGVVRPVASPTFVIVNEYPGRLPLYHVDLYRIRSEAEALAFGLDEYLFGRGVTAIEWAEKIERLLPPGTLRVRLEPGRSPQERRISWDAGGGRGEAPC